MYVNFSMASSEAIDKLLHSTIVPRPIAWISTEDRQGRANLAPFSFFNVFSTEPPILGIGIGERAPGVPKDTARNILETGEFVVNLVRYDSCAAMNLSASNVAPDVDEAELAGVDMVRSTMVMPRRVRESPVALECRLEQSVPLGPHGHLILGRVLAMHLDDAVMANPERHHVDAPKLDLIGRMHGSGWYARTTDLFQMKRV